MAQPTHLDLIAKVPLFAEARLDADALAELAAALVPRRFAKSCAIFQEGSDAGALYVVASGRVGIYKRIGASRVLLAELGAGAHFGEMGLVDGGARSADADALDDTELLELGASQFDGLIEKYPRLALGLLRVTSHRLRSLTAQVAAPEAQPRDDDDAVTTSFPHPIAAVNRHLGVLVDPRPRLERFFDLLEVSIRVLGAVTLASYLAGERRSEVVDDALVGGLHRLTLGSWLTTATAAVQLYDGAPDALWLPELYPLFFARPGRRSATAKTLFEIVNFRNAIRHGAGGALSERDAERHLSEQLPKLSEVFAALGLLSEHPLIWLERMDYSGGKFVYRAQRCMGSHSDFASETFSAPTPSETGRLYLRHASTQRLLPLHPLLVLDTCVVCGGREIFFLHAVAEPSLEYTEFIRGHHHATEEPMAALVELRDAARDRLHRLERRGS